MVEPNSSKFYTDIQEFYDRLRDFREKVRSGGISRDKLELERAALVRSVPRFKDRVFELTGKREMGNAYRDFDVWDTALSEDIYSDHISKQCLNMLVDLINQTLGTLEAKSEEGNPGLDSEDQERKNLDVIITKPPKVFIAHGGSTPALRKLRDFLSALGVKSLVVEDEPSEGRSVCQQVEWCLDKCNCAIVLATKGDIDGRTGEFLPRGNVLNEIGRFQERFKGRIIYLLETSTKFPSNISEKVRERFTPQSMDKAFIKVARELRAFGIIKVAGEETVDSTCKEPEIVGRPGFWDKEF